MLYRVAFEPAFVNNYLKLTLFMSTHDLTHNFGQKFQSPAYSDSTLIRLSEAINIMQKNCHGNGVNLAYTFNVSANGIWGRSALGKYFPRDVLP